MEKDGVDVGGEQQPFLPQSPLLLEPASQVKELVRLHQETEKVLGFPRTNILLLTMITALGVGPLNSLGTMPNRWLYIFKSPWNGDYREPPSPG